MIEPLTAAIRSAECVVVITGAGISLASGISTFRGSDPGAVWSRDVLEKGTAQFFEENPAASWSWYLDRFGGLLDHQPNAAHHALVALERWVTVRGREFLLVTQNVDTLHEAAGSTNLVKVHGTADRVRCARDGCANGAPGGSVRMSDVDFSAFQRSPEVPNLPRCARCGSLFRPHVLWFDEYYTGHQDYQIARAIQTQKAAQVTVFVGTSFSVGITEMTMQNGLLGGQVLFSIDPSRRPPNPRVGWIPGRSEEALPVLVAALNREP